MTIKYIKSHKMVILLTLLVSIVCFNHILFLKQMDYVVYDHDQRHTAKPALKGYYQLKNGEIGDFVKGMFSHHEGYPRYPAFIGYLMALACYFFGLNEVVMRCVTLLFYLLLIFYTYKCAKELDSQETAVLSILIMVTIPAMVFWSRMIFPTFFGAVFIIATFYYMLKSEYFLNLYNSILFGLFSGLCLLTHRMVLIPLFVLWIIAIASSFKERKIVKSLKGLMLAFLTTCIVSGRFLFTYFKTYDIYRDVHKYSIFNKPHNFRLLGIGGFFWRLKEIATQFGYDNLVIIFLLIMIAIFKKRKKNTQNKVIPFQYFTIASFCLFLGIWFIVTYFSEIRLVNARHFQVFAPMIAIVIAIYLNRSRRLTRNTVIFIKGILLSSLILMIMPQFGNGAILTPFRNYYRIPYIVGHGNGVIWSDRTFARKEEFDYFKKEISEDDIAVIEMPVWNHLLSLCDRLKLNGIGRVISFEDANLSAIYLMFYCVSSDNLEEYLLTRSQYVNYKLDPNRVESLLKIEKFINDNITDEIGSNEKVAIINTYGEFVYADIIEKIITNFEKIRCFKYHVGNTKMYKVIFKCSEGLSELKNFKEWRKYLCFLRRLY